MLRIRQARGLWPCMRRAAPTRAFAKIPSREAVPTTTANPLHPQHATPSPSGFPGPILRENELEDRLHAMFDDPRPNPFPAPMTPPGKQAASMQSSGMSKQTALQVIEAMVTTRVAHNVSRRAALSGLVHYTIGPGGHEGVASVAAGLRISDPALLHYRDTAFQVQRALQAGDNDMLRKLMRSYTVSSLDTTTGGRHKALGDKALNIIPSTSTISSHFPRAAGLAASVPLTKGLGVEPYYPRDAVVVGSGGDAGINHASFVTAVNFLKYSSQGLNIKIPALFLITDNGIGISVKTPVGWVENQLTSTGMAYFKADGTDMFDVYHKTKLAEASSRAGHPTFLHIQCARLFNHAGSDGGAYQTPGEVAWHTARDPLPAAMHQLVQEGLATKGELKTMYASISAKTEALLEEVCNEPKLDSLEQIEASLYPRNNMHMDKPWEHAAVEAAPPPPKSEKTKARPLIYKQQINRALQEMLREDPRAVMVGEDIGRKGGNYGVTDNLQKEFGPLRVRDSLLDETSILGMANGFALNNLFPVVEICYLAYLHNAIDQLRGEACTLSFFSDAQYTNGMIVRIAGGGLTEFGGHFHNENSLASLLDIPGLVLVYPSNGPDYVRLFRSCREAASRGRVVVIIEPIKAYALRDFGKDKIQWTAPYPDRSERMELGALKFYGDGKDLAIATYGNGVVLALEAQRILAVEHGVHCTVVEQPTLRGCDAGHEHALAKALAAYPSVLFADESRNQGAISHEVISSLATTFAPHGQLQVGVVTAADSLIPLGVAAKAKGLYLSEERIVESALKLLNVY